MSRRVTLHAVAEAQVPDAAAGLDPQPLAVSGAQLQQDLRAGEAPVDDLPAAVVGRAVGRLHDAEVLGAQQAQAVASRASSSAADERHRPKRVPACPR